MNPDVASVQNTSESLDWSSTAGTATITGVKAGTTYSRHYYYTSQSAANPTNEVFKVTVKPAESVTSLEISGDSSVEQFKSMALTTNADTDVTWTTSDASVATIDDSGKVTGVKQGTVTITAATTTSEGKVLTATHEVTVTASTVSSINAYLFFQNSPTANPDSNETSEWLPSGGRGDLKMNVNIEGAVWSYNPSSEAYNCYNNVSNRVVSWPDGSTGSSWEIKKTSYRAYWTSVFNAWKSTLEKEQGTTVTEDDVEAITLRPYKISYFWRDGSQKEYHLDCKVEVKCKKAITAVFYLQDAGASGFAQYDATNYKLVDGSATVAAPATAPVDIKTKDGITYYKFMGWYTDEACTQSVSFPDTVTSNVSYYAKYVPMDQTIKVNYYLEGTTTSVAPSKTISQLAKGQTVTESAIDVAGYELVSEKTKTAVAGTDDEINFYYKASEVGYTVEYYWNGDKVSPIETDSSARGTVGQTVTVNPKTIDGYTAVSDDLQSITLDNDASKNVIKFYYRKNVELTANSDSVTYDGKEHSVSGFTGAPEGADFSSITVGATGTDAGDYSAKFADGTVGTVDKTDSYIVTKANDGKLTINKRAVTVTANSKSKKYDGSALTDSGWSITPGSFVDGEGFESVTVEGSQLYVGSSENKITGCKVNGSTDEKNYAFTFAAGTLTVTDGSDTDPVKPTEVVTKTHSGTAFTLGDTVTFTITAKNIYDTAKTMLFFEIQGVTITGESEFENVQPGETVSTTATHTITEDDVLAGKFVNKAMVSFSYGKSYEATDTVTTEVAKKSLASVKTVTSKPIDGKAYRLGETVTFEVKVTNNGNQALTAVKVVDQLAGAKLAAGESATIEKLEPGESATLHYSYTIQESDLGHSFKNVVTATADDGTTTTTESETVPVADAEKKSEEKKSEDTKKSGDEKSATPKTGDALLASEAIAAIAGTGVLGVVASRIRRKK